MTRRLTYIAVLVAISLILKTLGNMSTAGDFRVTFVYVPWIVAGVVLGPLGGCAVALITDILGTVTAGQTPIPLLMLGSALYPLFPALLYRLPGKFAYLKIVIGSCISLVVCTLGLNTLGLALFRGIPYLPYLVTRVTQIAVFVVNIAVVGLLLPVVRNYLYGKPKG